MVCPKCGSIIADGSAFCTVCGTPMPNQAQGFNQPQQPGMNYNQQSGMNYNQPQQPGMNFNQQSGMNYNQPQQSNMNFGQQPYNQQQGGGYSQPPKQNTGLIIGVIIGSVVLIAAIVLFLVLVVFKDKDDDSGSKKTTETTTVSTTEHISNTTQSTTEATTTQSTTEAVTQSPATESPVVSEYDLEPGTYTINSLQLEGQIYNQSDIAEIGYSEMTLRVANGKIYYKQGAEYAETAYDYSITDYSSGTMWNSVEKYTFYYNSNELTIDFASSPDFAEYSQYTITFLK